MHRMNAYSEDLRKKIAERALREAAQMHNRLDAAGALRAKGIAQGRQGHRDDAAGTLEEALALVRPMPYPSPRRRSCASTACSTSARESRSRHENGSPRR
jgi:hypothetical protein